MSQRRGYRKRIVEVWRSESMFEVTEQRFMDQFREIKKNKCLAELEIEKIKRRGGEREMGQDGENTGR